MEDADALQNLLIKSSTDGDIEMGLIGARDFFGDFGDNPSDLETVTIDAAVSSTITQWGIDADDSQFGSGSASTVNTINITGARSSTVNLFGSALVGPGLANVRGSNVAGPVFKMQRMFGQVGDGHFSVRERLRKGDEMQAFFEAFEKMLGRLRDIQGRDMERIDKAIASIEGSASSDAVELLKKLRAEMQVRRDG
jgi:methyl-accepting chemotaxis protein